jgi:hypothetical protein
MAKIKVNLADFENAIFRSPMISYSDDKKNLEIEIEVIKGDDPSNGDMVDMLVVTLDRQEKDYKGTIENIRHIAEIFPANQPSLQNRITTQKSSVIPRAKAIDQENEDAPF